MRKKYEMTKYVGSKPFKSIIELEEIEPTVEELLTYVKEINEDIRKRLNIEPEKIKECSGQINISKEDFERISKLCTSVGKLVKEPEQPRTLSETIEQKRTGKANPYDFNQGWYYQIHPSEIAQIANRMAKICVLKWHGDTIDAEKINAYMDEVLK